MKISIVIPVYNEALQLEACLQAIAAQSLRAFEVIVVDNNSDDDSAAIARSFPFVTLLHEPKQGVLHARTHGFNAARGNIIARIDADSIIAPDWLEQVAAVFADTSVDAVSGVAEYYNVVAAPVFNAVDLFFRRRLARRLKDRIYLWGANMAMRRSAWQQVASNLCNRGGMHEDFDIAIHLQEMGGRVVFDERLHARVSSRRVDVNYLSFLRYALLSPGTYAQHKIRERIYMYEVVAVCALFYMPARVLHRGYDPRSGGFSWARLFSSGTVARVDPTTNVA